MNYAPALLGTLEDVLRKEGMTYPPELLAKFKAGDAMDDEHRHYLLDGGEAGAYYHWLTLLARHSDARLILELGNRYGMSTIALFHGLRPDSRLVSVDVLKDQRYIPDIVYKDPRVKILTGDGLDLSMYPRQSTEIPFDIDVFWTDTVHYYAQVSAEWAVYEPLLADECLVVVDDIRLHDKGKFFDEMPYEKVDLAALCHGNGFGVFWYKRPSAERGRSKEDRLHRASLKSMEIGYARYWTVQQDHDTLVNDLRNTGIVGKLRKSKHLLDILRRKR